MIGEAKTKVVFASSANSPHLGREVVILMYLHKMEWRAEARGRTGRRGGPDAASSAWTARRRMGSGGGGNDVWELNIWRVEGCSFVIDAWGARFRGG